LSFNYKIEDEIAMYEFTFIFYVLFIDNNIILIVLIHKTLKGKERTAAIVRLSAMAVVTKSAILIDLPQTWARRELFDGPPV